MACACAPGVLGAAPAPALRRALQRAPGPVEGRAGAWVHVFFDLRCPVCALLHRRSRGGVRAGSVRLHWIPVALLGAESLAAAASLLAAGDAPGALGRALAHPRRVDPSAVAADRVAEVEGNTALLRLISGGNAATPSLVFEEAAGELRLEVGLPPAWREGF